LLVLKEAADDIAERINKGYLPQQLVWQTLPSISYPLVATMFSEDEFTKITKRLYMQLLSSGGANQHDPKAILPSSIYHFWLIFSLGD
jgi:hypothetical protein